LRLKGKNGLITGGSQGIGLAIAKCFHREGATVSIVGRSLEKLKKAQESLGEKAFVFPADITKITDLDRLYSQSHEKTGKLDILVANAGIAQETPLVNTTEADFDLILSANLKGVFFTVQRALPYLNEGASIILIASLAAKQGVKNFSVYAASKAAVISLAQSFAAELLPKKIRVNSISPGVVRTTILESAGLTEEALETWTKAIPMHRIAMPAEIGEVAVFLASQESSYITATDIAADGGVSGISPL
jgi:NAD(P)-dependent dehydrogenase (short-subunit alcohol dehydrogenase family)